MTRNKQPPKPHTPPQQPETLLDVLHTFDAAEMADAFLTIAAVINQNPKAHTINSLAATLQTPVRDALDMLKGMNNIKDQEPS